MAKLCLSNLFGSFCQAFQFCMPNIKTWLKLTRFNKLKLELTGVDHIFFNTYQNHVLQIWYVTNIDTMFYISIPFFINTIFINTIFINAMFDITNHSTPSPRFFKFLYPPLFKVIAQSLKKLFL